jgi:DNA-directed RNA polymerase specialized sigma24 family protein
MAAAAAGSCVGAVVPGCLSNTKRKETKTMSPMMNEMLIDEVVPRLRHTVRSVPKIGHEDHEEIVQDATLMAARMMDSAEKAGRKFGGSSIAYYSTKAARSGRRSYYTGRSDVMSPGCQIDGKARHESLDDEIEFDTGDSGVLHDVIAPYGYTGQEPDPAEEAARNLDWESFLASHPVRHRTAILVLVKGGTMREAGKRCGLKDSAALNLKRRIAADLVGFFGEDVIRRLLDGRRPGWESDLRMSRERHLCHVSGGREEAGFGKG